MQPDYELAIIVLFAIIYSIIIVIVTYKTWNNKFSRIRLLWKLIIYNEILFLIGLLLLVLILPLSLLDILSWVMYDLVISYVIAIEIPGYFRILRYDEKCVVGLNELRKNLVKMRYSFELLGDLKEKVKGNSEILADENFGYILNDFISLCDQIKNLDINLWELTLSEITEVINRISQRTKHPFPKLIDILSLTGLSFLLAQVLKLLS